MVLKNFNFHVLSKNQLGYVTENWLAVMINLVILLRPQQFLEEGVGW